jgi:hypothetical protein
VTSISVIDVGQLRDQADVGDAGGLQPIEHFHQLLQLNTAVAAEVDLLVATVLDHLTDALLEHVGLNRLVAQVDDVIAPVGNGHGDERALAADLLVRAATGSFTSTPR